MHWIQDIEERQRKIAKLSEKNKSVMAELEAKQKAQREKLSSSVSNTEKSKQPENKENLSETSDQQPGLESSFSEPNSRPQSPNKSEVLNDPKEESISVPDEPSKFAQDIESNVSQFFTAREGLLEKLLNVKFNVS